MKTTFAATMLWIVAFSFSCRKRECEEPPYANLATVELTFKDKSGANLYPRFGGTRQYNKDSLRVFDTRGSIYNNKGLAGDNVSGEYVEFYFSDIYQPDKDADALAKKICKDYYVYYSALDTDTLQVCYQVQQLRCGSLFAPFELYYRGQLIAQSDRGIFFEVIVTK